MGGLIPTAEIAIHTVWNPKFTQLKLVVSNSECQMQHME